MIFFTLIKSFFFPACAENMIASDVEGRGWKEEREDKHFFWINRIKDFWEWEEKEKKEAAKFAFIFRSFF